jgi:hypothetical protein
MSVGTVTFAAFGQISTLPGNPINASTHITDNDSGS